MKNLISKKDNKVLSTISKSVKMHLISSMVECNLASKSTIRRIGVSQKYIDELVKRKFATEIKLGKWTYYAFSPICLTIFENNENLNVRRNENEQ